ncbi:hypothetical protein C5Y96_13075 [Blastopirellula marina]|uniref:Uncharacterized protein n=2 Tax=Pirellulales TaxID=2691354 RepID=A0A2S8FGH4_9BACT|nr:hypothetical protein C5Y96_13075 [Blastopirellula marina]RCS51665.1 hypothetical protein DTL36_13085 [Bremerella cremea]
MLKGCGLSLLLLAVIAGGYMVAFDQVFQRPEGLIFGGISGLITFFCIGALTNAWTAWSDLSLISKAEFGLQLEDGRKVAVAGRIRAEGEALKAPFSGTECVICEYDVARPEVEPSNNDSENTASDFAGFLMTPCKIETSWGEVRLLGFPMIDDAVVDNCLNTSEMRAAREFLLSTEFEDRSGVKIVSVLSVFSEVWSDDDGRVTKHMRLTKKPIDQIIPPDTEESAKNYREVMGDDEDFDDLDDETLNEGAFLFNTLPKLIEKRVEPGEKVVVFGIYNEARRGLMPRRGSTYVNRLKRGTAEEVAAKLRSSVLGNVIGGLVVLAILHGVIAFAVMNLAKEKENVPPVDNDVRLMLPSEQQLA